MARRTDRRVSRRTFLEAAGLGAAGAAAGTAGLGFPAVLRAQARTFKVGVVHPVTGPLAEPGQACRLGAQMAADAINAAGGIKSLGGAKLELILGDTQTTPDVGRTEAERVVNQGAHRVRGQAVLLAEVVERAVLVAPESAVVGAGPQCALAIERHRQPRAPNASNVAAALLPCVDGVRGHRIGRTRVAGKG